MKYKGRILVINQSPISLFINVLSELSLKTKVTLFCGEYNQYFPQNIKYIKSFKYFRCNPIKRIFSWFFFAIHLSFYLLKNSSKFDKILIVSNPPFAFWASIFVRNKFSILIYDIYPNILKQLYKNNFFMKIIIFIIIQLWRLINTYVYYFTDQIFTISDMLSNEIKKSTLLPNIINQKISVIEPWSNIYPTLNNPKLKYIRKKLKRKKICYSYIQVILG